MIMNIKKLPPRFHENKNSKLDVVLHENNYEDVPPQGDFTFDYSNSKKTVKMTWKSTNDEGIHKRGSENIYKNNPSPRGPAKSVKSSLASFKLFLLMR